ncbi:MAG: penicillin-binding transpeptidase domain-containing protein [Acidimicrobiales bacterium]
MGRRIRWMGLVLILCFALVILQLVNVQFRQASALNASQYNGRNTSQRLDNQRGLIFAATGTVIAQSKKNPNAKAGTYKYYRTYPTGTLFSGVVGYDSYFYGTSGIENVYNTQLSPHTQPARSLGQLLSPPPPSTDNVTLTVEKPLQEAAREALAAIPDANQDGAVVAIQPKTGAVLADYSSPSFDPNTLAQPNVTKEEAAGHADFTTKDPEGFNPGYPMATFDAFAPGSTFKVVTSAAVYDLDPSLITFNYPAKGCTPVGEIPTTNAQICNDYTNPSGANACGGTMVQMLPESCDPGYATLGLTLGKTNLYDQAQAFGFNATPPIDLNAPANGKPGIVSKSNFPTPTDLSAGHSPGPAGVAYSAFGQQTVTATALQNAMVAAGIANTGAVMTPHLMASVRTNAQDQLVESYTPKTYKDATSVTAAQSVNKLMQGVVTTPNGTANGVGFPPQDKVAAKTGTAQVGTPVTSTNDWMIGFAPATDPTVAVAVVVPYQPTSNYGATIAGPIMLRMIEATLALQAQQAQRTTPSTTTTTTPATTFSVSQTTSRGTTPYRAPTTTAPAATTTTVPVTTTVPTTTAPTSPVATTPATTPPTGTAGAAGAPATGT